MPRGVTVVTIRAITMSGGNAATAASARLSMPLSAQQLRHADIAVTIRVIMSGGSNATAAAGLGRDPPLFPLGGGGGDGG